MQNLPFSQASENNKDPILEILNGVFNDCKHVLEIGSGTGQHAVYFSQHLKHLQWQPSDRKENLAGINNRINAYPQSNLSLALELDVTQNNWPQHFDAVFSANTAHIMPWEITQIMLQKVARLLPTGGKFALYGPFNYEGKFTSASNEKFNQWLKEMAAHQGIRDFEKVNALLYDAAMNLVNDYSMPANNRLLVWKKC